jgi:ABC-type lipoprotein export system ATPase subunit
MEKPLLQLKDLSKYYTSGQSVVVGLANMELSFHRGEFVAVTGESGSGKSTLSHVIGGILPYESGEMYFNGKPTSHFDSADWEHYRRDHISFISQNYGILPGATVMANVVTALRLSGMDKKEAKSAAQDILQQVELWELRRRRAAKLSSGQKQRLSIARALAKPASILIADEPTGNLDPENSKKVIDLLAQAAKERLVILVTHEFSEAEAVATRHIILQDGKLIMDGELYASGMWIDISMEMPTEKQESYVFDYTFYPNDSDTVATGKLTIVFDYDNCTYRVIMGTGE